MEPAVLIVIALVLIVAIGIIAWQMEKKRRDAIARWALEHGWEFSPEKQRGRRLPFSIFGHGIQRYSRYHLEKIVEEATPGLDAAHLEIFEYHYARKSDKSTHHYHHSCALAAPGLDLGEIMIRSEGWADKIVQAIGFDDIDFEDHEFSKKFVVKAKDRKRAYDLIDPRMMAFLLENREWTIETNRRKLLVHRRGRLDLRDIEALAVFVLGFLAEIPRNVVNAERQKRGQYPLLRAGSAARDGPEEEE